MESTTYEVLSLLTEDLFGPWEIAIQVPVERKQLKQAIEALLRGGLAEWFTRDDDSAPAVALSQTAVGEPDLTDEQAWSPPALTSRQWLLGATPAGEEVYFSRTSPASRVTEREDPTADGE